jgi:hypothetical protein
MMGTGGGGGGGVGVGVGVGVAGAPTVTGAFLTGLLPPGPLHTSVKTVLTVRFVASNEPFVGFVPAHPGEPPDAVHEVASLDVQATVELPSYGTLIGLALKLRTGAGGGGGGGGAGGRSQ